MNKEDKGLLLKDLCGRLPYNIKVQNEGDIFNIDYISPIYGEIHLDIVDNYTIDVSEVKPYLFPLSSITKEHRKEISEILKNININHPPYGLINPNGCDALLTTVTMQGAALIEFYNKYHYDYNNLIPKGLAIDATGLNIY